MYYLKRFQIFQKNYFDEYLIKCNIVFKLLLNVIWNDYLQRFKKILLQTKATTIDFEFYKKKQTLIIVLTKSTNLDIEI